jgi:tetratricopeptide (TPR) repeat protein
VADSPRIEELKRRVQSDPASIAFAALAEEYRRAERFEEAIETCAAGLIRHPSYLSAHVTLGRALIEVGRLEDARNELEYVLKLAPENLAAIRGLAEIHDRLGDESHAPDPSSESQAHEPSAPEMTVAEIHAASGFTQTAAEETEPGPAPVETDPVIPSIRPPWEAEPVTPPVPPTWDAEPVAPPVAPTWYVEPFAPLVPPMLEAEPAPSYIPISTEETSAPETPPAFPTASYVQQTPANEPALTGLEEFLQAILRARAGRARSL